MGLYTIGHSTHDINYFISMLCAFGINILADVRGVPYSKYAPAYNREYLSTVLAAAGISYTYMGGCFGAKTADISLYDEAGCMDFEKMSATVPFKRGKEEIKKRIKNGADVALMCVEKDPIDCHRSIMVARAFALGGIPALHILPDKNAQSQIDLDTRLLDLYFPDRFQLSFLEDRSQKDMLRRAYKLRNRDLGYYLSE